MPFFVRLGAKNESSRINRVFVRETSATQGRMGYEACRRFDALVALPPIPLRPSQKDSEICLTAISLLFFVLLGFFMSIWDGISAQED